MATDNLEPIRQMAERLRVTSGWVPLLLEEVLQAYIEAINGMNDALVRHFWSKDDYRRWQMRKIMNRAEDEKARERAYMLTLHPKPKIAHNIYRRQKRGKEG